MSRSIEGRHDGRKIVFPIQVFPPEPLDKFVGVSANALLDTGATTSGITPRLVKQLDLRSIGKRPLGFARGESQVDRYAFRIGFDSGETTPSFPFVFEAVVGFELSDASSLDALIGMDILSQCDLRMERSARWTLSFG